MEVAMADNDLDFMDQWDLDKYGTSEDQGVVATAPTPRTPAGATGLPSPGQQYGATSKWQEQAVNSNLPLEQTAVTSAVGGVKNTYSRLKEIADLSNTKILPKKAPAYTARKFVIPMEKVLHPIENLEKTADLKNTKFLPKTAPAYKARKKLKRINAVKEAVTKPLQTLANTRAGKAVAAVAGRAKSAVAPVSRAVAPFIDAAGGTALGKTVGKVAGGIAKVGGRVAGLGGLAGGVVGKGLMHPLAGVAMTAAQIALAAKQKEWAINAENAGLAQPFNTRAVVRAKAENRARWAADQRAAAAGEPVPETGVPEGTNAEEYDKLVQDAEAGLPAAAPVQSSAEEYDKLVQDAEAGLPAAAPVNPAPDSLGSYSTEDLLKLTQDKSNPAFQKLAAEEFIKRTASEADRNRIAAGAAAAAGAAGAGGLAGSYDLAAGAAREFNRTQPENMQVEESVNTPLGTGEVAVETVTPGTSGALPPSATPSAAPTPEQIAAQQAAVMDSARAGFDNRLLAESRTKLPVGGKIGTEQNNLYARGVYARTSPNAMSPNERRAAQEANALYQQQYGKTGRDAAAERARVDFNAQIAAQNQQRLEQTKAEATQRLAEQGYNERARLGREERTAADARLAQQIAQEGEKSRAQFTAQETARTQREEAQRARQERQIEANETQARVRNEMARASKFMTSTQAKERAGYAAAIGNLRTLYSAGQRRLATLEKENASPAEIRRQQNEQVEIVEFMKEHARAAGVLKSPQTAKKKAAPGTQGGL